ncbi:hypothetical protein B5K06_22365 [Rhizobium grahamii]|uniref:Uncharacterized protein n=2 Tax=Rhizobium grahamii TaxID=1120045 RepID=S3H640_9HYPH|nr:hypothetical protein RGCCGE502_27898 [Rhizobium grahamii CCGE 502]RDJ06738.1 hypothetical protein B5K06_22365 [Rhizobium grahamii]
MVAENPELANAMHAQTSVTRKARRQDGDGGAIACLSRFIDGLRQAVQAGFPMAVLLKSGQRPTMPV